MYKITYPVQLFSKLESYSGVWSRRETGWGAVFLSGRLDNLLVTDIGSHQLKIFTPQGDLLTKVGKKNLVVLFYKITYPVQLFSKEGELLRCLVSQEKLGGALYFCLDGLDNLLVTDIGSHQLKIIDTPTGV